MPLVRRAKYLFFSLQDTEYLDIDTFLKGKMKITGVPKIVAISILKSEAFAISPREFQVLSTIPWNKWVNPERVAKRFHVGLSAIYDLARKGMILVDGEGQQDEELAKLKRSEETLFSSSWDFYAALYHFMTKWRDIDFQSKARPPQRDVHGMEEFGSHDDKKRYDEFLARIGKPPTHFHKAPNALEVYKLPLSRNGHGLYELLLKRKTTRNFDPDAPVTLKELSTILYYTFGCHGYTYVFQDIAILKKTSPSGGGLHPVEAYPLIINVEGVDPGLYHYDVENHALELIAKMDREEARESARFFMAGQDYFSKANAVFVMTARFYRNMWKYKWNPRTYSVMLMDAAHLSQTVYLVSTQLGLGAFVTTAINNANIEQKLGIDGFKEGAIAMVGCGRILKESEATQRGPSPYEPDFSPYTPRKTELA